MEDNSDDRRLVNIYLEVHGLGRVRLLQEKDKCTAENLQDGPVFRASRRRVRNDFTKTKSQSNHRCTLHKIARNDDNPLNKKQSNGNNYHNIIEAAEARD